MDSSDPVACENTPWPAVASKDQNLDVIESVTERIRFFYNNLVVKQAVDLQQLRRPARE